MRAMREFSGLLTDLYELTMAAGYLQTRFEGQATFELFVRHLPPRRNYLVAAGLEQALEFLENVHFTAEEIAFLQGHPVFRHVGREFFDYLAKFRFTGDAWAMPEGTLAFSGEPILRITAPIIEAQIMETYLLAAIGYQTAVASKAARVVTAAQGRQVVEFGARRGHGPQSSLWASRAAVIGGCEGTSNVLAGQIYGLETYGTQAHSWVMAHDDEATAFRNFLSAFPEHAVLLLDTYDVRAALRKIVAMKIGPAGVRLDSGDLARESRWVRRELDRAGWKDVKIFASGDLDESRIAGLLRCGAAIDAFGVGSALVVPGDAAPLSLIYKLVEVERSGKVRPAAKFAESKATYPGRKQVFRSRAAAGKFKGDTIALANEPNAGEPLLIQVMREGRRCTAAEPVHELRARFLSGLDRLPRRLRDLKRAAAYPVAYSKKLRSLLSSVLRGVR